MKLILLGAPGAGKGTISKQLVNDFRLVQYSTGDIFRSEMAAQTDLGRAAHDFISAGKLVPDQITIEMVLGKILGNDNYILDGFPRSMVQAEAIKSVGIDRVIYLDIPQEVAVIVFLGDVSVVNAEWSIM